MNKIVLEITGIQRIDRQKDKIEMATVGTIEEDADAYIVKYTEEQEPPMAATDVCVKIYKNEKTVEMTRSGSFGSFLIIEKSKRNLCRYGTEYGDILMGISGRNIEIEHGDGKGCFSFSYDIDINGALASKNELKMEFKNNQE